MSLGRSYAPDAEIPASAEELVGVAEISARTGLSRQVITNADARRRVSGFPEAVARLRMGPVYRWTDVQEWHSARYDKP